MYTISDRNSELDGKSDGQRVESAVRHNVRTGRYRKCQTCGATLAASAKRCPLCGK